MKKVNWWLFFRFLVSLTFLFLFSSISLLPSSESALLQLLLHCRSLLLLFSGTWKRGHSFSSRPCCMAPSGTSTNVGCNLCTTGSAPLHYPSSPLHTGILATACFCAWSPALGSVRPLSPSPLVTCPSKNLPWSCKAVPYTPWPHCLAVLPLNSPLSLRAVYTGVIDPHGV